MKTKFKTPIPVPVKITSKELKQGYVKRFIFSGLELGGKDPAYVCSDADLNHSVETLVDGSFYKKVSVFCSYDLVIEPFGLLQ